MPVRRLSHVNCFLPIDPDTHYIWMVLSGGGGNGRQVGGGGVHGLTDQAEQG